MRGSDATSWFLRLAAAVAHWLSGDGEGGLRHRPPVRVPMQTWESPSSTSVQLIGGPMPPKSPGVFRS